jgi:hypothetical protein
MAWSSIGTVWSVETWRLFPGALLIVSGVVLVLYVMARARERDEATGGTVAVAGSIAFTVLVLLTVFTLTVFPVWLAWLLVALVGVTVSVMMLAS